MQTLGHPAAPARPADDPTRHLTLTLSEPWPHRGPGVEVAGWVPERCSTEAAEVLAGRAVLNFRGGAFDLSLDPTADERRALAHLCTVLALRMSCSAARERAARQADAEEAAAQLRCA